jgi:heme-degrading monooxygenase HmoA
MAYFLVRHEVSDFNKWKKAFDETRDFRKTQGEKNFQVFRSADQPNEVIILCEWESVDSAKRFASAPDLSDRIKEAGVVDQPDLYFLEMAHKS